MRTTACRVFNKYDIGVATPTFEEILLSSIMEATLVSISISQINCH